MKFTWPISKKIIATALIFGAATLTMREMGFRIPVLGTVHTDPRELFLTLGAALSGPIGGIVIGLMSISWSDEINAGVIASLVAHVLGGFFIGITYKKLVYQRLEFPWLLFGWAGLVISFYYLILIPFYILVFFSLDPVTFELTFGNLTLWNLYTNLVMLANPELMLTMVITSIIIAALPPKYRCPMWCQYDGSKMAAKRHQYIDRREVRSRSKGWGSAAFNLSTIYKDVELYFHPFRYYVLYHLVRMLRFNIHPLQFIYSHEKIPELANLVTDRLLRWSKQKGFAIKINEWNEAARISILLEPVSYQSVFGTFRYPTYFSLEAYNTKIGNYKDGLKKEAQRYGLDHFEKIRKRLCIDAELIDPNKVLHVLLRLMNTQSRLKLEGKVGGAMLLITMAEMLRRFAEEIYNKKLPEEDELGFGFWTKGSRKYLYGSERVLDAPRNISNELMRQHGLDYGVRVRCYVEGETEYGALDSTIKPQNGIELINLSGNFIEGKKKGLAFRESLRNDKKSRIFSVVVLDADRSDFVRVVRKAAADDEICGLFFILEPDFELANFSIVELCEIIWDIAAQNGAKKKSKIELLKAIESARSGDEVIKFAKNSMSELYQLTKGILWGEALANYAFINPKLNQKKGKDRPIIEITRSIISGLTANYISSCVQNKVDPSTGRLVPR